MISGSLAGGGRVIVIVPQSSVTGKSNEEKAIKANILKKHTLEGVINLNKDTFYGVGTIPCIAIFTTDEPHLPGKECKFIDFKNDGFKVNAHIGLVETEQAKDKRQHLLDVWFDRIDADTTFCVKTTVEPEDEWLHGFYYFNDEVPAADEFEKTVGDYLAFKFAMIMQGRDYLFNHPAAGPSAKGSKLELSDRKWKSFFLKDVFPSIQRGKRLKKDDQSDGLVPYISSTALNNGVDNFIDNTTGVRRFANCLTIANSGSVGSTFFHPYEFVASDHVTHLRNDKFNEFSYLFVSTVLQRLSGKYNFSREINDDRIDREQILLPVTKAKKIDYKFMEQYARALYINKIKEYFEYLGVAKAGLPPQYQ